MKITLEMIKEKSKMFFQSAIKVAIIVFTFIVGMTAHYIYTEMKKPETPEFSVMSKEVKTLKNTSIAINERDELLVVNRADGTYEIYQDSVGRAIFNLYAGKIYSSQNQ